MAGTFHERAFGALAAFSLRYPRLLLGVTLGLILAAALLIPGLGISTSRYGLVADDEPYQARLLDFFERFGTPDAPVLVLSGGTPDQQRQLVDRLVARLGELPELQGRVLARPGASEVAEVLFLQRPDALQRLSAQLPPGTDLPLLLESGLPAWFGALADQLEAGLEGDESAEPVAPEQVAEGLRGLAGAADLFSNYLSGTADLGALGEPQQRPDLDERGYLQTADGAHRVITLFPEFSSGEVDEFRPAVEKIRLLRDEVLADAPPGLSASLTGIPALAVDENDVLRRGLLVSSAASALGILALCLLLFRSVRQTILAVVPLFGGTLLALGCVRLLYGGLNLVTSGFVSVLLGLGIDFSVHVLARVNEERRGGAAVHAAIHAAVVRTGPGILSGATITAVAFLATIFTDFTAYSELGVITAVGLAVIVVATLVAFPALLARTTRGTARISPEIPGIARLPGVIRRARVPLLVLALLTGLAGALALPRIAFSSRTFDFLPTDTESASVLTALEFDPTMGPMSANVIAPDIESARDMAAKLRTLDVVASVQSPTDLLPPLSPELLATLRAGFRALPRAPDFAALAARELEPSQLLPPITRIVDALDEVRFALKQAGQPTEAADAAHAAYSALKQRLGELSEPERARLLAIEPALAGLLGRAYRVGHAVAQRGHYDPSDLPELFRRRYVAKDGANLALFVVPAGNFWDGAVATRFRQQVEAVDPQVSGLAIHSYIHELMIVGGFRSAAGLAAGLILLLLILDFRGLRPALLAVVPTLFGWLWMLGLMAVLQIPFNIANIVCLPLVLGIGTAFGVHLMHRAEESARQHGGVADLDELLRGTGSAVIISALTTMVGFAALLLGKHGAMITFGLAMVLGIAGCLLASLLVLPALLVLFKRAR